ncbi:MAG TPA: hypothetical protein VJG66_00650 [Patescibacteria group bacterium]|nr:hypothetical protein [Patescibacteria group bacterium]
MLGTHLGTELSLRLLFAILAVFVCLFFLTDTANASGNLNTGGNIVLQKDEIINKDYFAGGETVTIAGTINGDAYIGAGKIIIDGTINGDLIAGGGEIIINGGVSDNIRVAGGNITVSGKVGRNATVLGGNINFTNSAEITGSLVTGAGNLTVYSPVAKDLYLGAGDVTIGNKIGGDINAGVGNLTLTSSAAVAGNLNYLSEDQAQILPGASVSGQLIHKIPPKAEPEISKKDAVLFLSGLAIFIKTISLISLAIIGLLIIRFFPKFSDETAKVIETNFWTNLVAGLLALLVVPVTFVLLLITIIGMPLAFLLLFAFGLATYVSKIFVSIWLGNFLAKKLNQKWNLYVSALIGLISLTVLSLIPIVGVLVGMVVLFVGLGALLINKRTFYLKLKGQL